MKMRTANLLICALLTSVTAFAQAGDAPQNPHGAGKNACMDMKGMDMKGMDMKGMDMKGMDMKHMEECKKMMGAKKDHGAMDSKATMHVTSGVVKKIDPATGKVTLAHEPVKSLNWPKMTMGFAVKDQALLKGVSVGQKVDVEFKKVGNDYVITSLK